MVEQPTKQFLKEAIDFLTPIIKQAGEMALESWDKIEISKQKNSRDIATKADIEIENFLKEKILSQWPDHGFWGEEGERTNLESPYQWLVDPIDGTKYYLKRAPFFQTHIALVYREKPVLGLIYNPVSRQLFSAVKNGGTYLNGRLIKNNSSVPIQESIIDIDFRGLTTRGNENLKERKWLIGKVGEIMEKSYRIRMGGSAFGIYLVTGAIDAYITVEGEGFKLQDLAPRLIIMKEAGYEIEWINTPFNKKILIVSQKPAISEIKEILLS
ncbi:inositol monophosphatase family protein [Patescibacteria group bacterium]|nr:inositol monophosphatase family protein [Patescibacteria group bacterium]